MAGVGQSIGAVHFGWHVHFWVYCSKEHRWLVGYTCLFLVVVIPRRIGSKTGPATLALAWAVGVASMFWIYIHGRDLNMNREKRT
jgi:hypothetical protein